MVGMELSHRFRGVSGKEYEYLLTSLDEVDRTPTRSGTYVLAALGSAGPIFLYCREARSLRDALVSARFAELRKISPGLALALYTRTGPDRDKPAREAEVDDTMLYYRYATVPVWQDRAAAAPSDRPGAAPSPGACTSSRASTCPWRCCIATITRFSPETRSMAPPMPGTILFGMTQLASCPAWSTCRPPSTVRSR